MSGEIRKVGVVGLGTMGAGIAQVCAQAGFEVVAREVTADLAERGRNGIVGQLDKAVQKGKLEASERDATLDRLTCTDDLTALAGSDLVIEAVIEEIGLKRELFQALEALVARDAILATNTSALSVTQIAASISTPERVVGLHFFNPAPVLQLVEVVRAELTTDDAFDHAFAFAQQIGKQPIACRDTPGFVVNRILIPVLNDAVQVLEEGTASPEDIDLGMKLGTGWPIGPLALIDLIGLDVWVHVCEALWQAFRDPRYAPPTRVVRMVDAGLLGRKSGRGFYTYGKEGS
jgi:3-hydroxybutyryl-CoA dehydrogenase